LAFHHLEAVARERELRGAIVSQKTSSNR
jgi:hypothetical protein